MTDFLSNKNKGFIWELLSEQKKFDGLNPKYKSEIQEKFEKTLIGISSQGRFYNLVEKNKEAIRIMVLMLEDYKKKQEPYTVLEIQEQRQKKFETDLEKKKNEFNGIIKKSNPDEIVFSDEKDTPIGEDMDVLLSRAMSLRAEQLNQVLEKQDTTIASEWIKNNKNNKNNDNISQKNVNNNINKNVSTTGVINLKIGKETNLSNEQVVLLDKKVNFNEDSNTFFSYQRENEENIENVEQNSFLTKFKKIDLNDSMNKNTIEEKFKIINDKLERILLNQDEIMRYFHNSK
jgi:hypothetical protein